jgi:outer membrane protein OmpA-like peptidoglycan-associated protein
MLLQRIFWWGNWGGLVFASLVLAGQATTALSQTASQSGLDKGQYIPNIWVDPDGCEHWVMDDGAEGYMTPHVTRDGKPVCRDGNICALVRSDTFFAPDSTEISESGVAQLRTFFQDSQFRTFAIAGHTDSTASAAYNRQLSLSRANAVAAVAQSVGARITSVQGYGETKPVASNGSQSGRAKNRRVEIMCVK